MPHSYSVLLLMILQMKKYFYNDFESILFAKATTIETERKLAGRALKHIHFSCLVKIIYISPEKLTYGELSF